MKIYDRHLNGHGMHLCLSTVDKHKCKQVYKL